MKRLFLIPALLLVATVASAQDGVPAGDCDCCQSGPLFPKLQAMLAVHRTQAQYSSFGSCQKNGCCQKGCVQKGCVQKGCVQKGCVQKGCVQKGCVQKGCVQKGCVQKGCVQKTCAPKCVQKPCVQKSCPPKGCCQKSVCQKGCVQKPCVQKSCCQKSVCQKSCSAKGGCGRPRGLLLTLGLFNRGGGKGKGCAPASCCGSSASPHGEAGDEIPTPSVDGGSDPFRDDPNPLRTTSYGRYR